MKVASLVPYKIMPARMGGQKGIYLFLKYVSAKTPVICYTSNDNEPAPNENFTVKKILGTGASRYYNILNFFRLKKDFKKEGISHLIVEHPYLGWLGILLKYFAGVKLVVHSHNIESLRFKSTGRWWWRILWQYEKMVHRQAHHSFFITAEDRTYAIATFKLKAELCTVITYGIEQAKAPSLAEKETAKQAIIRQHQLPNPDFIFLYNGTLDYEPNLDGLRTIVNEVNPVLLAQQQFTYTIIVCGNRLSADNKAWLEAHKNNHILFAGFVEDINLYFTGADMFLNPITDGGGIKTKLVEALAANNTTVSFGNGAIGIPQGVAGTKLTVVQDDNAVAFSTAVLQQVRHSKEMIPESFFHHFYWGNIADIVVHKLINL
jgi:hypothetical protein